jgi:hypothetical protein
MVSRTFFDVYHRQPLHLRRFNLQCGINFQYRKVHLLAVFIFLFIWLTTQRNPRSAHITEPPQTYANARATSNWEVGVLDAAGTRDLEKTQLHKPQSPKY